MSAPSSKGAARGRALRAAAILAAAASPAAAMAQNDPLAPSGRFAVVQSGAAQTPPMGWNPWNAFHADVDEAKVRAVAKAMVDSGLAARGYRFVNIDDGWALRRLADGRLQIRSNTFPSSHVEGSATGSFKPFTDALHALGLKAGIYTDIGRNTCMQRWDAGVPNLPVGSVAERQVGSFGYAVTDMRTIFADWRFDYIKVDACGVADYTPADPPVTSGAYNAFPPLIVRGNIPASDPKAIEGLYAALGDAVRRWGGETATLSICAWGEALSVLWGPRRGNLYRTSPDIESNWKSMLANIDSVVDGALYAGPGHWNDPDMLEIGHGDFDAAHPTEARSHFTMWTIMAAPLLLGYDLRHPDPALHAIVSNPEVIAIDQDAAGNQGIGYRDGDAMVVVRTLAAAGTRAVAFLNRGAVPVEARVSWRQLGFAPGSHARVRDVWARRDDAAASDLIRVTLPAHGSALLRVTGTPADPGAVPLDAMPARIHVAVDGLSRANALPMGRFPARVGATPDGAPLIAGGQPVGGIGVFANSRLEVHADRAFSRLVATPRVLGGTGPVRFQVYADRRLVQEVSAAPGKAASIVADIRFASVVELVTRQPSNGGRPPMVAWSAARMVR